MECFSVHFLQKRGVRDVIKRKQMPRMDKTDLYFYQFRQRVHVTELVQKRKRTQKLLILLPNVKCQ